MPLKAKPMFVCRGSTALKENKDILVVKLLNGSFFFPPIEAFIFFYCLLSTGVDDLKREKCATWMEWCQAVLDRTVLYT